MARTFEAIQSVGRGGVRSEVESGFAKVATRRATLAEASELERVARFAPQQLLAARGLRGKHGCVGPPHRLNSGVMLLDLQRMRAARWVDSLLALPRAIADGDVNGPVGTALVNEFLPRLGHAVRALRAASARFVTGASSGGWAALWLQVT